MDIFSKEKRSRIMSCIRSKRTKPEMLVHGWLKGNKIRHKMWSKMRGNPDVLFLDRKMVVFINGCFWHGCKEHFRAPKTNKLFWEEKIRRNRERQSEVIREIKKDGFRVVVLWEHELKGENLGDVLMKKLFKKQIDKRPLT